MAKFTNIRQRQIYWLNDCEPLDGNKDKDRPVIVVDTPLNLKTQTIISVVACSTHPNKKDNTKILLPNRHTVPETGLPLDCWAIPRWYLPINRFRLTSLKGNFPEELFVSILSAVKNQMKEDAERAGG